MSRVVVATQNPNKLRELQAMLGAAWDLVGLADVGISKMPEETGATYEENALIKARHVCRETDLPALADDSGIEVKALDWGPGVRSARFAGQPTDDGANNRKLISKLQGVPEEGRTARYVSVVVLVFPDGQEILGRGEVWGRIVDEPRGTGGFGYDPHFFLDELGKTKAELSLEHKNRISHRGRAVADLLDKLGRHGRPALD